jgi:hypothetical protein
LHSKIWVFKDFNRVFSKVLMVPWVPQNKKLGVKITPWAVSIFPTRALLWVLIMEKK